MIATAANNQALYIDKAHYDDEVLVIGILATPDGFENMPNVLAVPGAAKYDIFVGKVALEGDHAFYRADAVLCFA